MFGMGRRRGSPTHENATPDPEPTPFAVQLAQNALDPSQPVGRVERFAAAHGRPRRVYFTDPTGVRWRVFDTSYGPPEGAPFEEKHFPPPYAPAKSRVFVAANGELRAFNFRDRHAPEAVKRPLLNDRIVSAQFRFAGYPLSTPEEEHDPRRDFAVLPQRWTPPEHHHLRRHTSTLNRWTAYDGD